VNLALVSRMTKFSCLAKYGMLSVRWFLAYFRLNNSAICEMSKGADDYHDYPDSKEPYPWHGYMHTCARCGKRFTI
jgi:hypothetical protein